MNNTLDTLMRQVHIEKLWIDLGGPKIHRHRSSAFYRGGKRPNVQFSPETGRWRDHADESYGGRAIDLVMTVLSLQPADAIKWLETYTGQGLDNKSAAELRALKAAREWRDAAVQIKALEIESLDKQKDAVLSRSGGIENERSYQNWKRLCERQCATRKEMNRLSQLKGAELVAEHAKVGPRESAFVIRKAQWLQKEKGRFVELAVSMMASAGSTEVVA